MKLQGLEIEKILSLAEPFFSAKSNKDYYYHPDFITSKAVLDKEHNELKEVETFLNEGHMIELKCVEDLSVHFVSIEKNRTLDIEQIAEFIDFLDNVETIRKALKDIKTGEVFLDLKELVSFERFLERLKSAINPDMTLSDKASEELFRIRQKLRQLTRSINSIFTQTLKKYSSYLNEEKETVRNGFPVLAVKAANKGYISGLVQGYSSSNSTVFITPYEVILAQNQINEAMMEEKEEIARILHSFSEFIHKNISNFKLDYNLYVRFDSLLGRVKFGMNYNMVIPTISSSIELIQLGHLLINPDKIVYNDVYLGKNYPKILVISGPNAGGKTVLIKSISLACYMNQIGFYIDCKEASQLPVFSNIFYLSGDNQSILDNLSTFSGHVSQIQDILEQVDEKSLVVIDEIGQGTSPLDGEAIGIGVIKRLEEVGCYAVLTSHYDGIKNLALEDEKIENGAMIFSEAEIKPTFQFQQGAIGKSYALEVCQKLGLNEDVIFQAKEYLKSQQSDTQVKLSKIEKLQKENETLLKKNKAKQEELERLIEKRQKALDAINKEQENIRQKAEEKIDKYVQDKLDQIDLLFKNNKIDLKSMAKIKGELHEKAAQKKPNPPKAKKLTTTKNKIDKIRVNDRVRILSLSVTGLVKSINELKGTCEIDLGGMYSKVPLTDLELISHEADTTAVKVDSFDRILIRKSGVKLEVNLIGLTRQEAIEKLDKYLDDVLLANYKQVRIIHGFGTGALKEAVANYLSKRSFVKSFRPGGENEGGLGATVVYLK